MKHGKLWTYHNGCLCDECRQANSEYRAARRRRPKPEPAPEYERPALPLYAPTIKPAADWHDDAACLGTDTDTFFPDNGRIDMAAAAKAICRKCTVREECLLEAIEQQDWEHGIRGGMAPRQRRKYAKGLAA